MPSYFLLDLNSRYLDGYWFQLSDASGSLARHRQRWPAGRWVMAELRSEPDRPRYETALPLVDEERCRLSSETT